MKKYAIITPTFIGHFKFIPSYLKSFDKYMQDKNDVDILFVIEKESQKEFQKIITPHQKSLNIKVVFFDDILMHFNIKHSPKELLEKYGRFTYQTFKKMYAMIYANYDYYLVLDSESMVTKPTKMQRLFEDFFKKPFISGSIIDKKNRIDPDFCILKNNIDKLLNFNSNYWLLENFVWFYDINILKQLFQEHGTPLDMADKIYKQNKNMLINKDAKLGIFEVCLYQNYLYKNHQKLGYEFKDIDKILKKELDFKLLEEYKKTFYNYFKGSCGILEHTLLFLNEKNINPLIKVFQKSNFNIIRCDETNIKNYKFQKKFLEIVQPNILAASQNHVWGINNNNFQKFNLLILDDKLIKKIKKGVNKFIFPIFEFVKWIILPIKISIHILRLIIKIIKNIVIILTN